MMRSMSSAASRFFFSCSILCAASFLSFSLAACSAAALASAAFRAFSSSSSFLFSSSSSFALAASAFFLRVSAALAALALAASYFLYSELSSSINYFQMQGDKFIDKVLFSATCPIEKELLMRLSEKSFVPVSIPSFYEEYMTSEFNPARFAGCISLAKAALEG